VSPRGSDPDLPPLREVIARHRLVAAKSLGQHFLLDLNLTDKIARAAGDLRGADVVEVGPGPGGLTRALLKAGARRVFAIERDRRFLAALDELAEAYPGRLVIVHQDAATANEKAIVGCERPVPVVANLPYNVGTALLVKWLTADPWPPWWKSLTLLFQKEVAARLAAEPGGKTYGRLSVLAQWRSDVQLVFDIPARAFTPPPKVDSTLVRIVPRADDLPGLSQSIQRVTEAAFGQRRKMLRASLKSIAEDAEALLMSVGLDPRKRAEQLTVDDFIRLAGALEQSKR